MTGERTAADGSGSGQGEVARLRADVAALAAALRPVAGDRLDRLWAEVDGLPDAAVARALEAARGIRQMAEAPPAAGRRSGRSLGGIVAAFALGLVAGIFVGRQRR